ncbi:response regulator [Legionella israelensis]|uniref:Response regulator n=1 Tax=Legionella israelensis TaxID=454 RepID=A0AAX1EG99_9GAMM|nr:response regulator [Legionella israelensis]QBR84138.1 response regulator [Legionella israelensis]
MKLSVLVVDDNPVNRLIACKQLKKNLSEEKIQIDQAEDGNEAIHSVKKKISQTGQNYDAVLMDYSMPNCCGDVATAEIRRIEDEMKIHSKSKIITWTTEEKYREGLYNGSDERLSKPINVEELKKIIKCLMADKYSAFQSDATFFSGNIQVSENKEHSPCIPKM